MDFASCDNDERNGNLPIDHQCHHCNLCKICNWKLLGFFNPWSTKRTFMRKIDFLMLIESDQLSIGGYFFMTWKVETNFFFHLKIAKNTCIQVLKVVYCALFLSDFINFMQVNELYINNWNQWPSMIHRSFFTFSQIGNFNYSK